MSMSWRGERRSEARPESPGRRATDPIFDREPDEGRVPWSDHKRAAIRAIRAGKEPVTHSIFNEALPPYPDFEVIGEGPMTTVYLLRPLTDRGAAWIGENIGPDAQFLGDAVAVEHRYIGDIVQGLQADGLTVK